jgi:hypothetical protein
LKAQLSAERSQQVTAAERIMQLERAAEGMVLSQPITPVCVFDG